MIIIKRSKIGAKLFAPEWFDLDRSGKMMKLPLEIETKREERPHCIFCGFDGSFHSMRKYKMLDDIPFDEPIHYACDICGHQCNSEALMQTEISSYKNGFSDYRVDKK